MSLATGSSGNPIPDSISRGAVIAALQGLLTFVGDRTGWLSLDDIALLTPATTLAGVILYGIYDHLRRRWAAGEG